MKELVYIADDGEFRRSVKHDGDRHVEPVVTANFLEYPEPHSLSYKLKVFHAEWIMSERRLSDNEMKEMVKQFIELKRKMEANPLK